MSNSSDPHSGETVVLLPFGLSPEDLDALKKECRLLRFVPGEPKSRKESRWVDCLTCGSMLPGRCANTVANRCCFFCNATAMMCRGYLPSMS